MLIDPLPALPDLYHLCLCSSTSTNGKTKNLLRRCLTSTCPTQCNFASVGSFRILCGYVFPSVSSLMQFSRTNIPQSFKFSCCGASTATACIAVLSNLRSNFEFDCFCFSCVGDQLNRYRLAPSSIIFHRTSKQLKSSFLKYALIAFLSPAFSLSHSFRIIPCTYRATSFWYFDRLYASNFSSMLFQSGP